MATNEGHLKLTDYGLSKLILDKQSFVSTFVGTPDYMAPEVLGGQFDFRADIWALGIVMYELLFKESPYDTPHTMEFVENEFEDSINNNILSDKINAKIGYMSLPFRDLLLRLLEKDP